MGEGALHLHTRLKACDPTRQELLSDTDTPHSRLNHTHHDQRVQGNTPVLRRRIFAFSISSFMTYQMNF